MVADRDVQGSYKASDMNEDIGMEIDRLRGQALWGWDKESRNLGWFGLRDGMSILEVGSGPGFITEQLLDLYPNSHITCVEIDPDLVSRAERYLRSKGMEGRFTLIQGDLMKMDLPDDSFDFAVARLVFQHLRDPQWAMVEIRRVLKPGGKLAITDVDTGLEAIVEPEDREAEAIGSRMRTAQEKRGGNPQIGRRLWRLFKAAGYLNMDLELKATHSDKLGIEAMFRDEWTPGEYKLAMDHGLITEADLETLHKAHVAFHASPDKYALFAGLMVCGEKPA